VLGLGTVISKQRDWVGEVGGFVLLFFFWLLLPARPVGIVLLLEMLVLLLGGGRHIMLCLALPCLELLCWNRYLESMYWGVLHLHTVYRRYCVDTV
jgi:hypothetical protein